ncbi:MAG: M15 family metallopeptidase [Candidatus Omnitrophota bacterium]
MSKAIVELVDLAEADPSLVIDAAYARSDNFLGRAIYPENRLFLQKPAAERLMRAQARLRQQGWGLKIFDAYRPLSAQKIMWDIVRDDRYVANPAKGSKHNRGCAVDATLVGPDGREAPMPTPYDEFSRRAHRDFNDLPYEIIENRRILEEAMAAEGFIPLLEEWWHFDAPEWVNYPALNLNPYKTRFNL